MKDLKVSVLRNERIAENIYALTFELSQDVELFGGQFVNLSVGDKSLPLRRPLGICRVVGREVTVCYQIKGRGTRLLKEAKGGDTLSALLPLGNGFKLEGFKKVAVIGGGVGIFPLLFTLEKNSAKVDFHSFIGFRNSGAACFSDEIKKNSKFVSIVSDDGSIGEKGNAVDAFFLSDYSAFDAIISCGPPAMLKALKAKYLEKGLEIPCFVSLEERMACGLGACLVCVCKTSGGNARVCKDGPVFEIKEVEL